MCGIVGVVSHSPVNQLIYDSLLLLQHRGQDAAGIATVFWYRRKLADQPSPYRVPGYPWVPLAFVVTVLGVILATAIDSPGNAGMSLLIIAIGVPVYALWRWRANKVAR